MTQSWLDGDIECALEGRRERGLLRMRRECKALDATHVEVDGRRLINFAGNDYLGLAHHPLLMEGVANGDVADGAGAIARGAGASGLVSGFTPEHARAERAIAQWKGTAAAIFLPSGYQAAHAAIQTFSRIGAAMENGGVRFLLDKLIHASLIDAVRASGRAFRTFGHNDMAKLRRLLAHRDNGERTVVVSESIFSMDGDSADLAALAELREEFGYVILLDEAHASGVFGNHGAGLAAEMGLTDQVDVSMVTLSKGMGLGGGALCGSKRFCEGVINFARAYIYSTSTMPAVARGAMRALSIMRDEPERQKRVRLLANRLRTALRALGAQLPPGESPIVPVIFGSAGAAVATAGALEAVGFFVVAMRPPTVARGTSRLRLTVSCEHTETEIDSLAGAVGRCLKIRGVTTLPDALVK